MRLSWRIFLGTILAVIPLSAVTAGILSIPEPTGGVIDSGYILKLLLVIMIGALGYLISLMVNNFSKAWKENSLLQKELAKSVQTLTLESKLMREQNKQTTTELKKISTRLNHHSSWIRSHIITHTRCPDCHEVKDLVEANGD